MVMHSYGGVVSGQGTDFGIFPTENSQHISSYFFPTERTQYISSDLFPKENRNPRKYMAHFFDLFPTEQI